MRLDSENRIFTHCTIGVTFAFVKILPCQESMRLLDSYCAALAAFHDSTELSPVCSQRVDPTWCKLVGARREYWTHVEMHGCRQTGDLTTHLVDRLAVAS